MAGFQDHDENSVGGLVDQNHFSLSVNIQVAFWCVSSSDGCTNSESSIWFS